jgi:hypothetical protein
MENKNLSSVGGKEDFPVVKDSDVDKQNGVHIDAYRASCLCEDEMKILREQIDVPEAKTSYVKLYRYATGADIVIMVLSAL